MTGALSQTQGLRSNLGQTYRGSPLKCAAILESPEADPSVTLSGWTVHQTQAERSYPWLDRDLRRVGHAATKHLTLTALGVMVYRTRGCDPSQHTDAQHGANAARGCRRAPKQTLSWPSPTSIRRQSSPQLACKWLHRSTVTSRLRSAAWAEAQIDRC